MIYIYTLLLIHQFAKTECSERMKSCFQCRKSVLTKDDSSKYVHVQYICIIYILYIYYKPVFNQLCTVSVVFMQR